MIPKILYHGTTQARYHLGIQNEGLRGNLPTHMKIDEQHRGYVYLTENKDDAIFYSLYTLEMDKLTEELSEISKSSNAGIVITIKTSNFKDTIEEDPEYHDCKARWKRYGMWEVAEELCMRGMYYRTKTTIPTKYFAQEFIIPADKQSKKWMDLIAKQASDKKKEDLNQRLIGAASKSNEFVELQPKVFLNSQQAKDYFYNTHGDHNIIPKAVPRYDGVNARGSEPDSFFACSTCKECVIFDSKDRNFIKQEIEDEACLVMKRAFHEKIVG